MSEVTPPATPPAATPTQTGTGQTVQVPFGQAPATPPATPPAFDMKTFVPAEFKDKPYLADVDSVEKLFKKLDGAQTLLGKRPAGIPEANASKEQWDAFWKTAGKPEKAADYEFEPVEGLQYNDEFTGLVKNLMHEAHVPKDMAKALQKGFDNLQLARAQKQAEAEKASDAEFDKLVAPHMGADVDKALKNSQAIIKSVLPADMAAHLDKLTTGQAALLAVVVNKLAEKYIAPDKIPMGDGGDGAQGNNLAEMQTEARAIMARPEYWRPDHPEYATLQQKAKDLYAKIGALQGKK